MYKNNLIEKYLNTSLLSIKIFLLKSFFNCTKLLVPRNGTNVEETVNIENKLNLVYNIFM